MNDVLMVCHSSLSYESSICKTFVSYIAFSLLSLTIVIYLEVVFQKYEDCNLINLISETGLFGQRIETDSSKRDGGRDFIVNCDGTISCTSCQEFVLGIRKPRVVLVEPTSPLRLEFVHGSELGQDLPMIPLVLKNFPGYGVVPMYAQSRQANEWSYIELAVGRNNNTVLHVQKDGNLLVNNNDGRVFDVAYWKYQMSSAITMLKGSTDAQTKLRGGGRDFTVNLIDGTISPVLARQYVLGMDSYPDCTSINTQQVVDAVAVMISSAAATVVNGEVDGLPPNPLFFRSESREKKK
jgi:hypothetical protein